MARNSIYSALGTAAGMDKKKLAIAYVYSLLKSHKDRITSTDPILSEAQNVFVHASRIGRYSLQNYEEDYIESIEQGLTDNNHQPVEGTVDAVVWKMLKNEEMDSALEKIGESIKVLMDQKGVCGKSKRGLRAGEIQRYEQRAVLEALSEYV